jgi:hypothetical protein
LTKLGHLLVFVFFLIFDVLEKRELFSPEVCFLSESSTYILFLVFFVFCMLVQLFVPDSTQSAFDEFQNSIRRMKNLLVIHQSRR